LPLLELGAKDVTGGEVYRREHRIILLNRNPVEMLKGWRWFHRPAVIADLREERAIHGEYRLNSNEFFKDHPHSLT
jgi:hypothetical protein